RLEVVAIADAEGHVDRHLAERDRREHDPEDASGDQERRSGDGRAGGRRVARSRYRDVHEQRYGHKERDEDDRAAHRGSREPGVQDRERGEGEQERATGGPWIAVRRGDDRAGDTDEAGDREDGLLEAHRLECYAPRAVASAR